MSFFSWLQNRTLVRSRRADGFQARLRARHFRPQLEALEDRWVPSKLKVTNTWDWGPGSLRYEIAQASSSGSDTIVFDRSLLGRTINLGTELRVTNGVTIQGPG